MLKRIFTHETMLTSLKLKKLFYNKIFSFKYITINIIILHNIIFCSLFVEISTLKENFILQYKDTCILCIQPPKFN